MRGDHERLQDMLDACRMLQEHLGGNRENLEMDPVAQAAAQRWIEIIGEAASRISPELRDANPDVPWSDVIGMRHILAHGYFDIDVDIVWQVIDHDAAKLEAHLMRLLPSERED